MLLTIVSVIYVLVAIAMIVLILMQRGSGAAAGSGFGGGASATVFGARGSANFLSTATKWLAAVFMIMSLAMAWNATRSVTVVPVQDDLGVMSEVPTAGEAGLPGFEVDFWIGYLTRAGTPRASIDRLYQSIAKSMAIPEVRERIIALGAEPVGNTPEEFGAYIKREFGVWAKIIREVGIKVE